MAEKPWEGRFTQETNELAEEFTSSISFDKRLYRYDIKGSMAYCEALAKAGIVSQGERDKILQALKEIEGEIEQGEFPLSARWEDIHMHIEQRLREKIGEVGGKLHTGRSRNDQISMDMRLYLKEETIGIHGLLKGLQASLVGQAAKYINAVMPGYTHLRKAQPILFSHYLMAYYEMFKRDRERVTEALRRIDVLPLGSGAMAGTPYAIDREYLGELLGFTTVSQNSIDAVSDRDFVVEFLSQCALMMMHLSRLCEELILWSAPEFGFLRLPQSFCTGSSIMPQKENPDVLELIRAKTGRVYGALVSLLTILRGLPLAYNRDLQEDKEPLFDAVDTVKASLTIMAKLLEGIEVNQDRMREAAAEGFTNATDLADYLVKRGIPFRKAHQIAGKVVKYAEEKGKKLEDLSLGELRSFSSAIGEDIFDYIRIEGSVDHRQSIGGTARQRVAEQIKRAQEELAC
ncbi:MAG: argininosuccinate lyase [Deltaproteobacteria bacterium]|nr:MAG: argininosuccinate lyase [Deltaproteobacteria bacterium]